MSIRILCVLINRCLCGSTVIVQSGAQHVWVLGSLRTHVLLASSVRYTWRCKFGSFLFFCIPFKGLFRFFVCYSSVSGVSIAPITQVSTSPATDPTPLAANVFFTSRAGTVQRGWKFQSPLYHFPYHYSIHGHFLFSPSRVPREREAESERRAEKEGTVCSLFPTLIWVPWKKERVRGCLYIIRSLL